MNNYFKTAWRNLTKHKVFSFINLFGLTTGLTAFLLIALYVVDEMTYDAFHSNADRIYRVIEHKSQDGRETKIAGVPYRLGTDANHQLPAVKAAARITNLGRSNITTPDRSKAFYEAFWTANPEFLTTFDFTLLEGNRQSALDAPHSAIVTEEMAIRLFGSTQVVGKTILTDRDSVPCTITGVVKNFPTNSHISFNACFSEASFASKEFQDAVLSDWSSSSFPTYLLLAKDAEPNAVAAQVTELVAKHSGNRTVKVSYDLQPLKKVHFYSQDIEGNFTSPGNIRYIYVFVVVALFILIIASINYTNLTTARFANRAKEIAVRKVSGASRMSLIRQFLAESFLFTVLALIFALLFVQLLLPPFNEFAGKQLTLGFETDFRIWIGVAIIAIFVALLSGIYPALIQSALPSVALFRKKVVTGKGGLSLRSTLVIFQFALSIAMIVATIVVYLQVNYVRTMDMGFNKSQLLVIDINSGKVRNSAETIKTELSRLRGVTDVSISSRVPGEWKNLAAVNVSAGQTSSAANLKMYFIGVDEAFVKTFGITVKHGRNLTGAHGADSNAILINETAAKQLGMTDASGQVALVQPEGSNSFTNQAESWKWRVVGIVEDFNFQSLRQPLAPLILGYHENPVQNSDYFTARLAPGNTAGTLKEIESIIHRIDPGHLFEFHFLDKQWDLFYREDQIRQTLFIIVALLTIVIACLGLLGLATYAAEQRIKEIGIRKVLGATVASIVVLLTKDFLKLVLISAVIAFPVAGWVMNRWLADFAYRVDIHWWIFGAAALLAVTIAVGTIGAQAIRSATSNPVRSLRSE